MRVIVGCEFSQVVTKSFRDKGHEAYSCDLLPTEGNPKWHFQEDILQLLKRESFDLGIFHPPCTYLTVTGNKWFKPEFKNRFPTREKDREKAIEFFLLLAESPIPMIAIENPIGIMSTIYRKPDQIIQPWQFWHGEVKATCLWLQNLPKLIPTKIVENRVDRVYREPPSSDRWKKRSRTYQGIADAMADQWGIPANHIKEWVRPE